MSGASEHFDARKTRHPHPYTHHHHYDSTTTATTEVKISKPNLENRMISLHNVYENRIVK